MYECQVYDEICLEKYWSTRHLEEIYFVYDMESFIVMLTVSLLLFFYGAVKFLNDWVFIIRMAQVRIAEEQK